MITSSLLFATATSYQAGAADYDTPAGETVYVDEPITGSQGVFKFGEGTLVLKAYNIYTGLTWITGGTVRLSGNTAGIVNTGTSSLVRNSTLTIDGAYLETDILWIEGDEKTGLVEVNNGSVEVREYLSVGDEANGRMVVTGSSSVAVERLYVGFDAGVEGELVISGSQASFYAADDVVVAYDGNGLLRIENGASATFDDSFHVSYSEGVSGTVQDGAQVNATNFQISNGGSAYVVIDGQGTRLEAGNFEMTTEEGGISSPLSFPTALPSM